MLSNQITWNTIDSTDVRSPACRALAYLTFISHYTPTRIVTVALQSDRIEPGNALLNAKADLPILSLKEAPNFLRDLANAVNRAAERLRILQEALDFAQLMGRDCGELAAGEALTALHDHLSISARLLARVNIALDSQENLDLIDSLDSTLQWPPNDATRFNSDREPHLWLRELSSLELPWIGPNESDSPACTQKSLYRTKLNRETQRYVDRRLYCYALCLNCQLGSSSGHSAPRLLRVLCISSATMFDGVGSA